MTTSEMVGPITLGLEDNPVAPIFYSKACRQLGVPSEMQPVQRPEGGTTIRVRLPRMPRETWSTVQTRAAFLQGRDRQGKPTEQLPSGRWPDSMDEFADQVPLLVRGDKETSSVYLDFGRSIQAIGVSPAVARTVSMLIMEAANELDPEGELASARPELVSVARVRMPGTAVEREGTVLLGGVVEELKAEEEKADV